LTVVGDDLQSIYQWRGSDVSCLLKFGEAHDGATSRELSTNYRSKDALVRLVESFAETISPRYPKQMQAARSEDAPKAVTFFDEATDEAAQAAVLVSILERCRNSGYQWRDAAILLRSVRSSGVPILR